MTTTENRADYISRRPAWADRVAIGEDAIDYTWTGRCCHHDDLQAVRERRLARLWADGHCPVLVPRTVDAMGDSR